MSIIIDRPPSVVWRSVEDIASHVEWMADAEAIRFTSASTRGVGTTFDCDTKIGPFRLTDRMEITEWIPNAAMGVSHVGTVTGAGRFLLGHLFARVHITRQRQHEARLTLDGQHIQQGPQINADGFEVFARGMTGEGRAKLFRDETLERIPRKNGLTGLPGLRGLVCQARQIVEMWCQSAFGIAALHDLAHMTMRRAIQRHQKIGRTHLAGKLSKERLAGKDLIPIL